MRIFYPKSVMPVFEGTILPIHRLAFFILIVLKVIWLDIVNLSPFHLKNAITTYIHIDTANYWGSPLIMKLCRSD